MENTDLMEHERDCDKGKAQIPSHFSLPRAAPSQIETQAHAFTLITNITSYFYPSSLRYTPFDQFHRLTFGLS